MKISLAWLREFVDFDLTAEETAKLLRSLGFDTASITHIGGYVSGVVTAKVESREKHPNADKLSVCQVDIGPAGGVKTIVCGAQNYQVGDRVPVALPGAILPGNFEIKQSKIRGQSSDGMMCSEKELGIADDAAGLLILPGRPELGTPINAVLPPGDTVFDIEITPNRPDCLSVHGLARDVGALFASPFHPPAIKPQPDAIGAAGHLDLDLGRGGAAHRGARRGQLHCGLHLSGHRRGQPDPQRRWRPGGDLRTAASREPLQLRDRREPETEFSSGGAVEGRNGSQLASTRAEFQGRSAKWEP